MAICTLAEVLDNLEVDSVGVFVITATNDRIVLTSDQGVGNIEVADSTYEGSELATTLQTAMNADNTLTGTGTITFTVTYSSTTYKFTIDAGSGHTIAYTHTGSDAGLTYGFKEDHTAAQTITSDNAVPGIDASAVQFLHNGLEAWVKNVRCRREFASTTYTNELYSSHGSEIRLRNYPIASIAKLTVSRVDAIKIKNTDTTATTAYVGVTSTALVLTVTGGTASSNSLTFASNTTMTAMVTAINALGSGWGAALVHSNDANILTTELVATQGRDCSSRGNTPANYIKLQMWGDPISAFEYDETAGIIEYAGFPTGRNRICITATLGYSSSDMPDDLKLAVFMSVQSLYNKRNEEGFGTTGVGVSGQKVNYAGVLPPEALEIFGAHKRDIYY